MSLDSLIHQLSSLIMASRDGYKSPHKVCMLLAVMDLIESGEIKENRIYFDYRLKQKYLEHFSMVAGEQDLANPHIHFLHLRGDGIWQHIVRPGIESRYQSTFTIGSSNFLEHLVDYAFLYEELYRLMQDASLCLQLRSAIRANLFTASLRVVMTREASGMWWSVKPSSRTILLC